MSMTCAAVGDFAAAVGEDETPEEVNAVRVVRPDRRVAEPHVEIKFRWDRFRFERLLAVADLNVMPVVAREIDAERVQLADAAVADQFAAVPRQIAGTFLRAGLQDTVVAFDGIDDRPALGDAIRERLLAVDVFAGIKGGDRGERVPVVGRGDLDDV